jgi:hypothetical protein
MCHVCDYRKLDSLTYHCERCQCHVHDFQKLKYSDTLRCWLCEDCTHLLGALITKFMQPPLGD